MAKKKRRLSGTKEGKEKSFQKAEYECLRKFPDSAMRYKVCVSGAGLAQTEDREWCGKFSKYEYQRICESGMDLFDKALKALPATLAGRKRRRR